MHHTRHLGVALALCALWSCAYDSMAPAGGEEAPPATQTARSARGAAKGKAMQPRPEEPMVGHSSALTGEPADAPAVPQDALETGGRAMPSAKPATPAKPKIAAAFEPPSPPVVDPSANMPSGGDGKMGWNAEKKAADRKAEDKSKVADFERTPRNKVAAPPMFQANMRGGGLDDQAQVGQAQGGEVALGLVDGRFGQPVSSTAQGLSGKKSNADGLTIDLPPAQLAEQPELERFARVKAEAQKRQVVEELAKEKLAEKSQQEVELLKKQRKKKRKKKRGRRQLLSDGDLADNTVGKDRIIVLDEITVDEDVRYAWDLEPEAIEEEEQDDDDGEADNDQWRAATRNKNTQRGRGYRGEEGETRGPMGDLANPLPARDDMPLILETEKPAEFLPRMCYFENTYLGGNAAYLEQLRRLDASFQSIDPQSVSPRPHRLARLPVQSFDAPSKSGIQIDATLHTRTLDAPGRVFLQIGLKGSQRYGWRRPPLDVMLVVDQSALDMRSSAGQEAVEALIQQLGAADRVGVILVDASGAALSTPLKPQPEVRFSLGKQLAGVESAGRGGAAALASALDRAGIRLAEAAEDQARIPGSRTVILLTGPGDAHRADLAQQAAHRLTLQGAVTSVIEVGQAGSFGGRWWSVANAGHGNYHRATGDVGTLVNEELEALSRVVARLLRLNIRLGKHADGVRILGSRVLEQKEVKAVKAREEATDRSLSESLGVDSDRGDDDDGIQTVIPYFYGGDDHVILVELWVEKSGLVADISLKYKDMVNLTNATAQTSVSLRSGNHPDTPAQALVKRNIRAFQVAEHLAQAGKLARTQGVYAARAALNEARALARIPADRRVVDAFDTIINRFPGQNAMVAEALELAAKRRVGQSPD
ncbi:MAG: hypothetical protein ACE366_00235 [Bradymonadia bacterium]